MAGGTSVASVLCLVLAAKGGAGNTLVGVGGLLDNDLLVGRLAGAAAHRGEPEEARGNGEGNAEPKHGKHLGAQRGVNVVGFEHGFKDASERSVDCCCGRSSGEDEAGLSLGAVVSIYVRLVVGEKNLQ